MAICFRTFMQDLELSHVAWEEPLVPLVERAPQFCPIWSANECVLRHNRHAADAAVLDAETAHGIGNYRIEIRASPAGLQRRLPDRRLEVEVFGLTVSQPGWPCRRF